MDELIIILLIIIGLAAKSSKKKKQQARKQRERQAGFDEISAAPPPKARPALDKIADALEFVDEKAGQVKIPYSRQEWAEFLNRTPAEKPAPAKPKAQPAGDRVSKAILRSGDPSLIAGLESGRSSPAGNAASEGQEFQKLNAQRLRPSAQHAEGESHREHAEHRQRIIEEEARIHKEREDLKELRSVNLQKLRSAVIMSEVLGKPVALRGRR